MKVLLYFENEEKIKKSGIGRALKHQIAALESQGIEYTLNPKDDFDVAHINTYWPGSKKVFKSIKKRGIPVIMHGHSTIEDFKNSFRCWKLIAKIWYNKNLMWFYKNADLIITPTNYSKICIDNYNLGTPVIAVSNGINPAEYAYNQQNIDDFKAKFNLKDDEKVVIGVGFPFNRKGIKDFIEIAREFPEIKFFWFGHLARILTQPNVLKAIKNKPDNVIMPGYIEGNIIRGAYHFAKAFLFTSYEETEGIVVLEALASNCPVLIRDIGVYADWMEDGKTCLKSRNNAEFAGNLNKILNSDNSKMVSEGYKLAEARTIEQIGADLKAAYISVLDKKNKSK